MTPEQAGIPAYGDDRRVPGLRREEVAMLTGASIDQYARLERGDIGAASDSVLEAVSRAPAPDEFERAQLSPSCSCAVRWARPHPSGSDVPRIPAVRPR
ncbi:helix-turn-helix domain-containing protein [Nocardiopsis akebiae]|uniref:helix-turn-helix domain-containing protein n=1 Tax=Nocardiopsis akebiae TaxID=2831968 RepID=UPI003083FDF2